MPQRPEDFQSMGDENQVNCSVPNPTLFIKNPTLFNKNGGFFIYEKLIEEVKKQNETLRLLLGLNEVPHVFQEDIKLTLRQQKDRFDLEDYIAYAKYLQREIDTIQD